MQNNQILVALLAGLSLLAGCGQKEQATEKKNGLVVINVLDKDTYADCHIAGSINIPFDSIDAALDTIEKNAEVVFYCANPMCTASGHAAMQFHKAGFANVSVYEGGTAEWYQKGLPIEGASCAAYLRQPVQHVEPQEGPVKVITAEELAKKMGIELPVSTHIDEEVAVESSEHCMNEQVATIEISETK